MGSRRTEVRLKVDKNNSLYYWYKVKNPFLVILNTLVIFILDFRLHYA